jgi:RNA polymerase sigma-70 factor (ECF subfamily)
MNSMTSYPERDLLSRITDGDQEAFNILFEQYRDRLFSYLYKVTKSKETAEEIVLDVFIKIWTGRSVIIEIDNFEAFLFRVARNKALDFLRWVQKSRLQQMELWSRMQEGHATAAADEKILLEDTATSIRQAIAQLSPQRKMVFQLSREHGLTYEQIAQRLHLSTHTVRNHMAASLQFIRSHLGTDLTYALLLLIILYTLL